MEGKDRGLIFGIIPAFAWRDWGKPTIKTSVMTADLQAQTWICDLTNTKQECMLPTWQQYQTLKYCLIGLYVTVNLN
jgi:hypothetical protein